MLIGIRLIVSLILVKLLYVKLPLLLCPRLLLMGVILIVVRVRKVGMCSSLLRMFPLPLVRKDTGKIFWILPPSIKGLLLLLPLLAFSYLGLGPVLLPVPFGA